MKMLNEVSVCFNCSFLPSCFSGLESSTDAEVGKSLTDWNKEQEHDFVNRENLAVLITHFLLKLFLL